MSPLTESRALGRGDDRESMQVGGVVWVLQILIGGLDWA